MSSKGIAPSEEKVSAVAKFLPDFSQVAEPLRMLTRKDQQFMWEDAQQRSFQKLKDLLTRAETLAYFKNECRTRIVADAGPTGIGAVLTQLQDGLWRVISYASRNLTDVERRYSQTEKEGLALVWACERFKLYVFGREVELETDHKPLQCIYNKSSKPCARIERWVQQGMDTHSALSDNAPQFVSEEFENFLATHGIQHQNFPLLWPQANDEIEQQNRTLLKSLKVAEVEGKKWKDELDEFLLAYRTTPHSSTGTTPAFLMF